MRKSVNCTSAHLNEREEAEMCSLCLPVFVCKFAVTSVNNIKIYVLFIIVFVLVIELRLNSPFEK